MGITRQHNFGHRNKAYTLSQYGHENSVMIERVRLQVQASKIRFLQKIKEVT